MHSEVRGVQGTSEYEHAQSVTTLCTGQGAEKHAYTHFNPQTQDVIGLQRRKRCTLVTPARSCCGNKRSFLEEDPNWH